MTLTPGKRKLYGYSGTVYLTEKEKVEVEVFHKQFGGQFVMNEQKYSDTVPDMPKKEPVEDPADDEYSGDE
jgi:hypothetical protein